MPLALYDLLVVPLLALDSVIWLVLYGVMGYVVTLQNVRADFGQGPRLADHVVFVWLGTFVFSAILDTLIAWMAWRIVRPPAMKAPPPRVVASFSPPSASSAASDPPANPRTRPFAYKAPLITAAAHVCLLALFLGFFTVVVPHQEAIFRQWWHSVPVVTNWTLDFSNFLKQLVLFARAAGVVLVVGLPFAAEHLGGRTLRFVYSAFYTAIVLLFMLLAGFSCSSH